MNNNTHRYLVVTELYLPTKGGTAVWFDEVYRRLGGKETHIVTADVPGGDEHDRGHPNTVHRVRLRRHWWLRPESAAMYAKLFWRALWVGFRHRFDAVHAGRVLPEGLVALIVGRLTRRPLVIYAHGEEITTWREALKARVMGFVYRRAERIVANSEFTREELIKLGVNPERIALIYPGVNVERFVPGLEYGDLRAAIGMGDDAKLIVSVGRLSRRKGFDRVIESLPGLRARGLDVHYAIIGIGEDEEYLKKLAGEHGVAERVHLLGAVSMEDLPRWYNAANVFAMPNREINGDVEGFGMVFIEAAACATPSVAGCSGGTGAAVVDGETGLRVDATDSPAVAHALKQLLENPQRAATLGQQAYRRAHAEFSWSSVADKTRQLAEAASARKPIERQHAKGRRQI